MEAERVLVHDAREEALPDLPRQWQGLLDGATKAADSLYMRYGKRALDLLLAVPLLVLTVPVILLLSALVVLFHGWPPFHLARRVGKDGREFRMVKIRTMVRNAEQKLRELCEANADLATEYYQNFKLKHDPRITRTGRLLRSTSLDELPQLWNVLRGEMSLVGPRPIVRDELVHYGSYVDKFLAFRPGITGVWQVNGRNEVTYPDRAWLELSYENRASLLGDLAMLVRTMLVTVRLNGR